MNRDDEMELTLAEANRLSALTNKQTDENLEDGEALELFRLSQKKAKQIIADHETNRSN